MATVAASPPGRQVLAIAPGSAGRWLVETDSGSRHLFDLDARIYTRRGEKVRGGPAWARGVAQPIHDVAEWPRVNARFGVRLVVRSGAPALINSSYVTRIVQLDPGETLNIVLPEQSIHEAVTQAPPTNAWLLIGDAASYPTEDELRAQRDPIHPDLAWWTSPRQIVRGDLVFIYFISPRKAVHFVARALRPPFYDDSIEVNAVGKVDPHQWWTELSPLVEVPALPFSVLRAGHDGHLVLKGKPTHYLTPEVTVGLIRHLGDLDDEQRAVLQRPIGDPSLPDPATMTLDQLRGLAGGRLLVERMVEEHVVRPLFRLSIGQLSNVRVVPQLLMPPVGVPDYGLYRGEELVGIVEVKLGVRRSRDGVVDGSPDVAQVIRYAKAANVPAALVDANEIFLIDRGGTTPRRSFERQALIPDHLVEFAEHFFG